MSDLQAKITKLQLNTQNETPNLLQTIASKASNILTGFKDLFTGTINKKAKILRLGQLATADAIEKILIELNKIHSGLENHDKYLLKIEKLFENTNNFLRISSAELKKLAELKIPLDNFLSNVKTIESDIIKLKSEQNSFLEHIDLIEKKSKNLHEKYITKLDNYKLEINLNLNDLKNSFEERFVSFNENQENLVNKIEYLKDIYEKRFASLNNNQENLVKKIESLKNIYEERFVSLNDNYENLVKKVNYLIKWIIIISIFILTILIFYISYRLILFNKL